jgi:hypothetical protein
MGAMIQLSADQRQAFQQGNPVRLHDPDLGGQVVVCPPALFERMEAQLQEIALDEKEEQAWLKMSARTLAQRLAEDEND